MKSYLKQLGMTFLSTSLLASPLAMAGDSSDKIKVMSRNVYLGADIFPVIAAGQDPNPIAISLAVSEVFQTVQATNFPERAQALADEIERRRPHAIGLQEVSQWFTGPADSLVGGTLPANDVVFDYLEILMAALAERDLDYVVAASIGNADLELPMVTGFDELGQPTFADLRLHDRDVVLVKNSSNISFGPALFDAQGNLTDGANFQNNGAIELAGTSVEFTRGFNMINLNVKGVDYLFVNTHLEVGGEENPVTPYKTLQAAQMAELIGTIDAVNFSNLPVILLGDFNSAPTDTPFESALGLGTLIPPYLQAVAPEELGGAGFIDLWTTKRKASDGFTCCFDASVSNADAELTQRIDHIFFKPNGREVEKFKVKVIGDSNADMTDISGLYPSDHAGVFGKIKLEK